jgi:hypothetical protein
VTPADDRGVNPRRLVGRVENGLDWPRADALMTALLAARTGARQHERAEIFGPVAQLGARLNGIQKVTG